MKKILFSSCLSIIMAACGGSEGGKSQSSKPDEEKPGSAGETATADSKGIGKFTKVEISSALDAGMADAGQKIYDVKCAACHKLTDEKLVGPGWKGVTSRRTPEWVMNFATNVDEMLAKDPQAQAQLEICLVRMPNQNLTDDDARHVLEFMRRNDGVK